MNLEQLQKLQRQFSEALCTPKAQLDSITPKPRFNIYQNAYKIRLSESLEEDFPECLRKLGKQKFSNLVNNYIQANPSYYWSLAQLSEDFQQHLSKEHPKLQKLAHYEWQFILTQLSAYEEPFNFSMLACLSPKQQEDFPIRLIKSAHFAQRGDSHWILFRNQDGVQEIETRSRESKILKETYLGTTIGKLSSLLSELTASQVSSYFSNWTSLGLLTKGES